MSEGGAAAPLNTPRRQMRWVWGLLMLVALGGADHARRAPLNNWDLVPYVAVSISPGSLPLEPYEQLVLHERTYSALRAELTASAYAAVTERTPYMKRIAKDSEALSQQLNFYRVKPLYVAALRGLTSIGLAPVHAVRAVSWGSYAVVGLLLLAFARATGASPLWAGALVCGGALLPPVMRVARLSTPDMMVLVPFVAGLARLLLRRDSQKRVDPLVGVLLWLAVCVRPNMVLACGAVLVVGILSERGPARRLVRLVGWSVAYAATVLLISSVWQRIPWAVHFTHSFVERIPRPVDADVTVTLALWWQVVSANVVSLLGPQLLGLLLPAAIAAGWLVAAGRRASDAERAEGRVRWGIMGALGLAATAQALLFPELQLRLFLPCFVGMGMASLAPLRAPTFA